MMKNVQQMSTMLPMGRSDDSKVCTTSFNPGAREITRSGRSVLHIQSTMFVIMMFDSLDSSLWTILDTFTPFRASKNMTTTVTDLPSKILTPLG